MQDDSYVPRHRPWDYNNLHFLFAVLGGFANSFYSLFFWFTWLFGGSPQKRADLLSYVQTATFIAVLSGAVVTLITSLLPIPTKFKIGYAVGTLASPILYSAFQATNLYTGR